MAGLGAMVPVLVPPEKLNTTVSPPVVMLFPAVSFACKVRIDVAPDGIVSADTVITDCAATVLPGTTVIVVVDATATPPIVA